MATHLSVPGPVTILKTHNREDSAVEVNADDLRDLYDDIASIIEFSEPSPTPPTPIERTETPLPLPLEQHQPESQTPKPSLVEQVPRSSSSDQTTHAEELVKQSQDAKQSKTLNALVSSAYQATRSIILRRSGPSPEANILVTDPAAVDMLLTCIGTVGLSRRKILRLNLLPGCPVSHTKIRKVIDGLPALSSLAPVPKDGVPDSSKRDPLRNLPRKHRAFLRWLLHSPFIPLASITPSATPHLILPSLSPLHIQAFTITRQPSNKESLFLNHSATHSPFPVFHGTCPSRIPLILAQGLRNMSGTRYQSNGTAMGKGIYLAADPQTSLYYSNTTYAWGRSQNWASGGAKGAVKVLLACELAGEARGESLYVVKDEGKVVVRCVFLIPGSLGGEGLYGLSLELEKLYKVLRDGRG
ncbi:hypothetical protein K505DRAFT_329156 [Melanomma pulvis-pyrius CBS 109.77]|uniref:PARP catalytic domain-containing protein n=1 Tax=Melanomma pulvis-pyrius CBS 109.77 TaxID=1314802 RepID=A0A6A6WW22_9PLEO|nr:hypothetical protein K505DRAFT_329156 [Melanomma pulvis-pyrius CBS 109.77]